MAVLRNPTEPCQHAKVVSSCKFVMSNTEAASIIWIAREQARTRDWIELIHSLCPPTLTFSVLFSAETFWPFQALTTGPGLKFQKQLAIFDRESHLHSCSTKNAHQDNQSVLLADGPQPITYESHHVWESDQSPLSATRWCRSLQINARALILIQYLYQFVHSNAGT